MTLTNGQRVTLLKIDDALAMTHRFELEVRQLVQPERVGYQGLRQRLAIVRQRGKRKTFYLDLRADDILLDGWEVPFCTDLEAYSADTRGGVVCSGNACYNLVGDREAIRQCIEGKAVFPVSDSAKAKIIVAREVRTKCNEEGQELLYPEIETRHAIVCRLKGA
ncbi:MAG: hypothetical protein ACJ8F7_23030 [Gemmataceae bacterium]